MRLFKIICLSLLLYLPTQIQAQRMFLWDETDPTNHQQIESLKSMKDRVDAGEDFGKIAEELSHCPSAKYKGELGWVELDGEKMVKDFMVALNKMEEDEMVIVETVYGYHLVQYTEKKDNAINVRHIYLKRE